MEVSIKEADEKQLREMEVPRFKNIEELTAYIDSLAKRDHEYGTCVYAMSMSAVAAFNYMASALGVTGFQASCADLDIIRRTRHMNCPFIVIKGDDMLYPQYNLQQKFEEAMQEWKAWAKDEAQKKLKESPDAHPNVVAHWQKLANE